MSGPGSLLSDSATPVVALELALNVVGLVLLWRLALRRAARGAPQRLTAWTAPLSDFFIFLIFAVAGGAAFGAAAGRLIRFHGLSDDVRLLLAAAGLQVGVLVGAAAYWYGLRRRREPAPAPASGSVLLSGVVTFLACLPLINLTSLAWQGLLHLLGLPVEKQELIDLLIYDHSPAFRGTLVLLAAVGAPMMEEIVFRAGFFRYLRTRVPRWAAYLLPAMLFGAAHANLASFAQLVVLGLVFSAAYERTGRIGTTIVAHSLFNLNTIAMILGGITN